MTISATQLATLSGNQRAWGERWNEQITAWHASIGPQMQSQIDRMIADKDLALVAALTDIVRIIRGEAPMNSGQGDNASTGAGGIGGEKIATKEVAEPTGAVVKGKPVTIKHRPIWSYRFPYLNKNRLKSAGGDGIWRVILDDSRTRVLGIFDYHGSGMTAWHGQGGSKNTAQ
ncbi:hypothetical protein [Sphingomonas sp. dw_22]|uniref:hypothetical protein n=1 Tax=Sphingomonas sp. dw_22 TaxID=2721175 RepID=UPI001BD203BA|nr:hypothetical protein [Sphingomonas sp. dw_22]